MCLWTGKKRENKSVNTNRILFQSRSLRVKRNLILKRGCVFSSGVAGFGRLIWHVVFRAFI